MNLLETRFQKRLTQWTLARTLGVHQSRISLIENGIVTPTESEKEALAGGLGVRIEDIEWPEIEPEEQQAKSTNGRVKYLRELATRCPDALLDRLAIERATRGAVTVTELAEADAAGIGPKKGFRVRGKPAYTVAAIVEWLSEREELTEE
jgi:transcriptional regulator with XRE-family HTH domain